MDSGNVKLVALDARHHWAEAIADELEAVAAMIRSGEIQADQGLLLLRNVAGGRLHEPARLGMPSTPIEMMGLCAYASERICKEVCL